jgi:hypothetical protein
LPTITLDLFNGLGTVTSVAGGLFNGQPDAESYLVSYYDGSTLLGSLTTPELGGASTATSWSAFSVSGASLTQVTITAPDADVNGWDFLVDDLELSTSVSAVPEPDARWLFLVSGASVGISRFSIRNRASR